MKKLITAFAVLLACSFAFNPAMAEQSQRHHAKKMHSMLLSPKMKEKLDLNPKQQKAWKAAVDKVKDARKAFKNKIRNDYAKVQQIIDAESKKSDPDLMKVFAAKESMSRDYHEMRKQVVAAEMDFYHQLNSDQKRMVFQKLKEKFEKRMERMKKMSSMLDDHEFYADVSTH